MSARAPDVYEAERQLRNEPPTLASRRETIEQQRDAVRSRLEYHAELAREVQRDAPREATDAEVRAAIEAAEAGGSDE